MNQDILRDVLANTAWLVDAARKVQLDTFDRLCGSCELRTQDVRMYLCKHRINKQNINHDCTCDNCPIVNGEVK